jgi:hypothetical protein
VPVILKAYQGLSPEKKQALLGALSPAFVKEAFSIVTCRLCGRQGEQVQSREDDRQGRGGFGTITPEAVDRLRARLRRWISTTGSW